jgi:nitrous oxidase accessory protein NosD
MVHDYNGDGISYQNCRDVFVKQCECIENEGLGFHPGSGTTHTEITGCKAVGNGGDGIYLCWRVTKSLVENCVSVHNRACGLSIGHKDTHNIIRNNEFSNNQMHGIFFRNESFPMGADFNLVENNVVKDNGKADSDYGFCNIRLRGGTNNVRFANNKLIFKNAPADETVGICMEENTFDIFLEGNEFVNCKKDTHSHWKLG